MIELRWLERKTGKQLMDGYGFYYDETERVLQQRVRYQQERWVTDGGAVKEMAWTEWADIPVVEESTDA